MNLQMFPSKSKGNIEEHESVGQAKATIKTEDYVMTSVAVLNKNQ